MKYVGLCYMLSEPMFQFIRTPDPEASNHWPSFSHVSSVFFLSRVNTVTQERVHNNLHSCGSFFVLVNTGAALRYIEKKLGQEPITTHTTPYDNADYIHTFDYIRKMTHQLMIIRENDRLYYCVPKCHNMLGPVILCCELVNNDEHHD
jgi:hypothetical protein